VVSEKRFGPRVARKSCGDANLVADTLSVCTAVDLHGLPTKAKTLYII
jgi:hypothetical protein